MTCIACIAGSAAPCTHPDVLRDPAAAIVVRELRTFDDETVPYVRNLANDIGIPVEKVRRILLALTRMQLATYGPLFNTDTGTPIGSSYWLTEAGVSRFASLRPAR